MVVVSPEDALILQPGTPSASRARPAAFAAIAALLIAWQALALLPFRFGGGLGERDGYRMLLGLLDCAHRGVWFDSALLYNRQVSFGYFAFVRALTELAGSSFATVVAVMNSVSLVAAVLFVVPFFFVVDRLFGRAEAVMASLLLPAVPVWWQVSRYGHPITPALLLFFSGLALCSVRPRAVLRFAAALLFAAALTFRFDVILLFPLIAAVVPLEPSAWRRRAAISAAYAVAAVLVFLAAQAGLPHVETGAHPEGIAELLQRYEDPAYIREFLRLAFSMVLEAFGAAFLAAWVAGCAILWRSPRPAWRLLFVAYPVAVNLVFWLPNPSPARHYIMISPAVAVCGAVVLGFALRALGRSRPAWWWAAGPAAAAAAVLIAVVVQWGPMGKVPEARSLFREYHSVMRVRDASSRLARKLVALPPLGRGALVLCDAYYVAAEMARLRSDVRVQLDDAGIPGQRVQFLTVHEAGNTFVMLVQSWEPDEIHAIDRAGLFPDAILIVDPYNPAIHYDGPRRSAAIPGMQARTAAM